MVAPEAASPPAAAPAQRASQAGPAVVDAEGRPVQLGARGTACAAKVCYGVLVFSSQDVDARRGPVCAPKPSSCHSAPEAEAPACNGCSRSPWLTHAGASQRCWGVHLRREGMEVPSVSANGAPTSVSGQFRFSCTGKAVHAAREGPTGAVRPGAAVDLPYCEGLEVRRSAARRSEPFSPIARCLVAP